MFTDNDKAQLLKLLNFSWDANELCRNFHGLKIQERFIEKFKEIFPWAASAGENTFRSEQRSEPPATKRARQQSTTIMPASRQAASASSMKSPATSSLMEDSDDEFDEPKMDKAINQRFQGNFNYNS